MRWPVYLRGSGERVLDPKAVLARGALADAQGIIVADCTEERSEDEDSGVEPEVATAIEKEINGSDPPHCDAPPAHPMALLGKGTG